MELGGSVDLFKGRVAMQSDLDSLGRLHPVVWHSTRLNSYTGALTTPFSDIGWRKDVRKAA